MKTLIPILGLLLLSGCGGFDWDTEPPILNQILVNGRVYNGATLTVPIEDGLVFTPVVGHPSRENFLLQIDMQPIIQGSTVDEAYPHGLAWPTNSYGFTQAEPAIHPAFTPNQRGLVRVTARAAVNGALAPNSPISEFSEPLVLLLLVENPNLVDVQIDTFCAESATATSVEIAADDPITMDGSISFDEGLTHLSVRFQDVDAATTTWYGNQEIDLQGMTSYDLNQLQIELPDEFASGDRVQFSFYGEGNYNVYSYFNTIHLQ